MRPGLPLLFPLLVQAIIIDNTAPFLEPVLSGNDIIARDANEALILLKRQNGCPAGFNSCSILNAAGACCKSDTICSRDRSNNIACCPTRAVCTGVLSSSGSIPATGTTSGFMFPQPGTPTTTVAPSLTGSTVPNAPYPFIYIPTNFRNQAECVSAYSGCNSQYQACANSLGGGVNGVTIAGPNGAGTTVQGAQATGNGQAICASLSREACHGLQEGYCTAFQGGNTGNAPPSTRNSPLYEILTALGIALAGMIA